MYFGYAGADSPVIQILEQETQEWVEVERLCWEQPTPNLFSS